MKLLSDSAAVLPLHAYRRTETGRRVTSGRLVELLDNPGAAMTQADLVSTLMAHEVVYGAAYLAKYRQQGEIAQRGCSTPSRSGRSSRTGDCASGTTPAAALSGSSPRPTSPTSEA